MNQGYIECGKIVSTHGVRGQLRVQPWADSPEFLLDFKTLYLGKEHKPYFVKSASIHKSLVLIKFENIDTVEDAEMLRGTVVYVARSDIKLPEGRFLICDLIGCDVFDSATKRRYGKLRDVIAGAGANDVWVIKNDNGLEYLVPAIPEVIGEIDITAQKIHISPMKGIFDDEN